jgi:nicotinamide mononucleotide transporter
MSLIEIIGFVLTLVAIALAARGHVWTWPLQLVASLLYVGLFFKFQLFGEATLQGVYAVLAVYGGLQWRGNVSQPTLAVRHLSKKEWLLINAVGLALTALVSTLQIQFLPTDVPVLDSSIFVFGLLAQWMQAKKRIENWPYWIVLNLLASGVYFYKTLYITSVLYVLLALLAIWGWRNWRQQMSAAA